jgi:hypothetical protein
MEAQNIVERAKRVRNIAHKDGQLTKATRFMTHQEKEAKKTQLALTEDMLSPSNVAAASLTEEGRKQQSAYRQFLRRDLAENVAPTDLSGEEKNAALKAERELAEQIKEGMLPMEVMRRNPPGAVQHHIKWEREKKDTILAWKNLRRLNNPDDDSEDLANIELLRPSMAPTGVPSFMVGAQIPGLFAMSPQAKENWPENMPEYGTVDSPMKQAEAREELEKKILALEARLAAAEKPGKAKGKGMSAEQKKASSERMKQFWAEKKAKANRATV